MVLVASSLLISLLISITLIDLVLSSDSLIVALGNINVLSVHLLFVTALFGLLSRDLGAVAEVDLDLPSSAVVLRRWSAVALELSSF